jgi:CheY-like chemotaxis protein
MSAMILAAVDAASGKEIQRILEGSGYSVSAVVGTGNAAIEEAERSRHDLLLVDFVLVGPMDGVVTASVLRERWNVPAVFLAPNDDAAARQRAVIAEPLGFVRKPVEAGELVATIDAALRQPLTRSPAPGPHNSPLAKFVHDLRSPLSGIVTAVDVLKSMQPTAEVAEIYDIIARQANTIQSMIDEFQGNERGHGQPRQSPTSATLRKATDASALTPGRVLIVEDHNDSIKTMSKMISLSGCEVFSATDATTGLAEARKLLPEIILCDLGLPGDMSGLDVAVAVRSDPVLKRAYLVAISGYGEPEDRRRSQEAGFDFHVTKPIGKPAMEDLLRTRPRF